MENGASAASRTSRKSGTAIRNKNINDFVGSYLRGKIHELPLDLQNKKIGEWDVSKVTDMMGLFGGYSKFNEDIGDWNVSNVKDMGEMFRYCEKFNQDLSKWNVSKVKNMYSMFYGCKKLDKHPNWVVNEKTDTRHMFDETLVKPKVLRRFPSEVKESRKSRKSSKNLGAGGGGYDSEGGNGRKTRKRVR
jgi:surface protein